MNDLQIFSNPSFGDIRTIEECGKVLFCGNDIAKALGYKKPNDAINAHCRATVKRSTPISGKMQEINFIPEGDIYRLAAKSELPGAEQFESWIFDEVLPSIRKHGAYMTPATIDQMIASPEFGIQLLTALKDEQSKNIALSGEVAKRDQIIAELNPKATYYDVILKNKALVNITQISKDYGMSGQAMNKVLHELGVQYKQGDQWLLYAKHHSKGYTHSQTIDITRSTGLPDVKMETKWTQSGRLFLYELLKDNGVIPVIENL
jgi:anti-repressor protein